MSKFGERLKELRTKKGLTQMELAEQVSALSDVDFRRNMAKKFERIF